MRIFTAGRLNRELSLLEMMLVLIVVFIFMIIFVYRLDKLVTYVEYVSFQTTLNNLRQGMSNVLIEKVMNRDYSGIAQLENINPFIAAAGAPLSHKQVNRISQGGNSAQRNTPIERYLGELSAPDISSLPLGHWYFDLATGELVYLVENPGELVTDLSGMPRIRFRPGLRYEDDNGDGRYTPKEKISGFYLAPLDQVSWYGRIIQ